LGFGISIVEFSAMRRAVAVFFPESAYEAAEFAERLMPRASSRSPLPRTAPAQIFSL
jgi:hypothetical protein